jgi:DNA-binding PadR family transcriptional regulator
MTTPRELTDFEQILLAHIGETPSSGYDLKRFFRTTPAAVYQPSGGALYPALRRLEQRGLLQAEEATSGRRSRRVYRTTAAGRVTTIRWVSEPVDLASVGRDLGLHLMRFVFMERILSPTEVHAFLMNLADALETFVAGMERYAAANAPPGHHPRLALEHGIAVHRASLSWAKSALATLAEDRKPSNRMESSSASRRGSAKRANVTAPQKIGHAPHLLLAEPT